MNFIRNLFQWKQKPSEEERFLGEVDSSVDKMRGELDRVARAAADALRHHHELEAEFNRYVRAAREWDRRARQALESGDEELARKALGEQHDAQIQADALSDSVVSSREQTRQLSQQVAELKRCIADAERQARTLVARRNAARAQQRMSDAMAGLGTHDHAFTAISRYEDTVLHQEAQSRVLDTEADYSEAADERAANDPIEERLAALRKELGAS